MEVQQTEVWRSQVAQGLTGDKSQSWDVSAGCPTPETVLAPGDIVSLQSGALHERPAYCP